MCRTCSRANGCGDVACAARRDQMLHCRRRCADNDGRSQMCCDVSCCCCCCCCQYLSLSINTRTEALPTYADGITLIASLASSRQAVRVRQPASQSVFPSPRCLSGCSASSELQHYLVYLVPLTLDADRLFVAFVDDAFVFFPSAAYRSILLRPAEGHCPSVLQTAVKRNAWTPLKPVHCVTTGSHVSAICRLP